MSFNNSDIATYSIHDYFCSKIDSNFYFILFHHFGACVRRGAGGHLTPIEIVQFGVFS